MSRNTIQSDKAEQIRQFNFTDIQILTGKRRKKKKKTQIGARISLWLYANINIKALKVV